MEKIELMLFMSSQNEYYLFRFATTNDSPSKYFIEFEDVIIDNNHQFPFFLDLMNETIGTYHYCIQSY